MISILHLVYFQMSDDISWFVLGFGFCHQTTIWCYLGINWVHVFLEFYLWIVIEAWRRIQVDVKIRPSAMTMTICHNIIYQLKIFFTVVIVFFKRFSIPWFCYLHDSYFETKVILYFVFDFPDRLRRRTSAGKCCRRWAGVKVKVWAERVQGSTNR